MDTRFKFDCDDGNEVGAAINLFPLNQEIVAGGLDPLLLHSS